MIVADADGPRREITAAVTAGGRLVDLRISPYAMEQDPRRLADEILRVIDTATTRANAAARDELTRDGVGLSAGDAQALGLGQPNDQAAP